jgi:hypothetical protein
MKRTLTAVALLVGLASQNSLAAITIVPLSWTGTYKDTNGGLMVMLDNAGKIDVSGTDRGSIYRLVCTIQSDDTNIANCTGDGVNFQQAESPQRFTYRSQLRRSNQNSFIEEWEGTFEAGSRSGKAQFKRVSSASR